jgi:DNA-binding NtrC family response regulator
MKDMIVNTLPSKILVVDDDVTSLKVLYGHLKHFGFDVEVASGGLQALDLLGQSDYDLIISDLRMPDMDGITLLEEVRKRGVKLPFIVVTACGSIESAVAAMRKGACDYLEKPYNPESLQFTVQRALDFHRAVSENRQIMTYLQEHFTFQNIITVCPAMKKTLEVAAKVSSSPRTTVAIFGESGTGKEVLAKAIHFASKGLPSNFIAVNCAAIPEALLESELFGHVKGAFTGAESDREGKLFLAKRGTIFLDEIGDMPLLLQAKLLRIIEERTYEKVGSNIPIRVECRVIVATHRNLSEMVQKGTFREDLYHRINVVPLVLTPLRERIEDIPILIDHFLDQFRQHQGKLLPGISKLAIKQMTSYDWPGNIRELRNIMEYASILVSNELIRPEHLRFAVDVGSSSAQNADISGFHIHVPEDQLSLEAITNQALHIALERCAGNKSHAAALLKVDRKRFYR